MILLLGSNESETRHQSILGYDMCFRNMLCFRNKITSFFLHRHSYCLRMTSFKRPYKWAVKILTTIFCIDSKHLKLAQIFIKNVLRKHNFLSNIGYNDFLDSYTLYHEAYGIFLSLLLYCIRISIKNWFGIEVYQKNKRKTTVKLEYYHNTS